MQLLVAHQILIASAIGLALIFGLRAGVMFARGGAPSDLALAAASILVALALGGYLRKVRARWLDERAKSAKR